MHVFRKKLMRMGNSCWLDEGDGKWMDMGKMTPAQIVAWCLQNKLPLMEVSLKFPEPARDSTVPTPEKKEVFRGVYADRKVVGRY